MGEGSLVYVCRECWDHEGPRGVVLDKATFYSSRLPFSKEMIPLETPEKLSLPSSPSSATTPTTPLSSILGQAVKTKLPWRVTSVTANQSRRDVTRILALHPDSRALYRMQSGGSLIFDEGRARVTLGPIAGNRSPSCMAVSRGGLLAMGSYGGEHLVLLQQAWMSQDSAQVVGLKDTVHSVLWQDWSTAVVGGTAKRVSLVDVRAGHVVSQSSKKHSGHVSSLAWFPDSTNHALVSGGRGGRVLLWDVRNLSNHVVGINHGFPVTSVASTLEDGGHLACVLEGGNVVQWRARDALDPNRGLTIPRLVVNSAWGQAKARYSPDGTRLAIGSECGRLFVCDEAGRVLRMLVDKAPVWDMCWDQDGTGLFVVSEGRGGGGWNTTVELGVDPEAWEERTGLALANARASHVMVEQSKGWWHAKTHGPCSLGDGVRVKFSGYRGDGAVDVVPLSFVRSPIGDEARCHCKRSHQLPPGAELDPLRRWKLRGSC